MCFSNSVPDRTSHHEEKEIQEEEISGLHVLHVHGHAVALPAATDLQGGTAQPKVSVQGEADRIRTGGYFAGRVVSNA